MPILLDHVLAGHVRGDDADVAHRLRRRLRRGGVHRRRLVLLIHYHARVGQHLEVAPQGLEGRDGESDEGELPPVIETNGEGEDNRDGVLQDHHEQVPDGALHVTAIRREAGGNRGAIVLLFVEPAHFLAENRRESELPQAQCQPRARHGEAKGLDGRGYEGDHSQNHEADPPVRDTAVQRNGVGVVKHGDDVAEANGEVGEDKAGPHATHGPQPKEGPLLAVVSQEPNKTRFHVRTSGVHLDAHVPQAVQRSPRGAATVARFNEGDFFKEPGLLALHPQDGRDLPHPALAGARWVHLQLHEVAVRPLCAQQFFVAALLQEYPFPHDRDDVGVAHRAQAVGDNDRRAALHEPVERLLHHALRLGVERRRRLVQK